MSLLKTALLGAKLWINKPDTNKTIVEGVETVASYRKTKRFITLAIIALLGVLLMFNKIDTETFIELFKEVE
jgi:hypothetical protein